MTREKEEAEEGMRRKGGYQFLEHPDRPYRHQQKHFHFPETLETIHHHSRQWELHKKKRRRKKEKKKEQAEERRRKEQNKLAITFGAELSGCTVIFRNSPSLVFSPPFSVG